MENNIYYIYNNFPCRLSVRPSVPVFQRTQKTLSFVFGCKSTAKNGSHLYLFGKNFKIDRRTPCKTLILRGIPPKRFFEAGHKLPIDIFYFLFFSDFYFSFFFIFFYYFIYQWGCGWSVKLTLEQ